MEIKEMTMEQVEARLAEIKTEIDGEGADIEALSAEVDALEERQSAIRAEAAEKRSLLDKVANMKTTPIDKIEERKTEMADKEFRNSPAYIEKYAEWFKDQDNAEKRAALLTENVDGTIAVPDLVYDEIKTAWNADEIMRDVETLEVRGNLKVNFEISGSDAVKHEEGSGAVDEQTLTEGIATLVPAYFKKWKSFSSTRLLCPPGNPINDINFVSRKIEEKLADTTLEPSRKQTLVRLRDYLLSLKRFVGLS